MESSSCETNELDSNILLAPRKRLLAGLKKQTPVGNTDVSLEEAVEASRRAATSSLTLAVRARAIAFDKAEIAARAMAAAKKALDLVMHISEDEQNKDRYLKKNRIKNHLPISIELAHQSMNASRISKSFRGSKSSKNKRMKNSNGNGFTGEVHDVRVNENTPKFNKLKGVENGEEEGTSQLEEVGGIGRKRGRMKQKKLPLRIQSRCE